LFASAISSALNFSDEVRGLGLQLGISTGEALRTDAAVRLLGQSTDAYAAVITRLNTTVRDNEERLKDLGVATRGANGELLSGQALFQNAAAALQTYRAGIDQDRASQEMFGRGVKDMAGLVALNNTALAAADTVLKAYNITLADPSAIAAYRAQMSLLSFT
jgi:hypothetical protein